MVFLCSYAAKKLALVWTNVRPVLCSGVGSSLRGEALGLSEEILGLGSDGEWDELFQLLRQTSVALFYAHYTDTLDK